jgi:hypothetical protein
VDLNDFEFITPFFNFIRDYIPFDQTEFIQRMIIRKIEENNFEFSASLLRKLVLRRIPDPWDDTKLYMGPYVDNKGNVIIKFTPNNLYSGNQEWFS